MHASARYCARACLCVCMCVCVCVCVCVFVCTCISVVCIPEQGDGDRGTCANNLPCGLIPRLNAQDFHAAAAMRKHRLEHD